MKFIFFVFLLFQLPEIADLQNSKDSIRQLYEQIPETSAGADSLLAYSKTLLQENPFLAETCAELALEISQNLKYQLGEAEAHRSIGNSKWKLGDHDLAIAAHLKALELFDAAGDTLGIANVYMNLGLVYDDLQQYEKSEEYHRRAIGLFRQIDYPIRLSHSLNNLAAVFHVQNKFDSALFYYTESLAIRLKLNSTIDIAESWNNIGVIHQFKGEYDIALEHIMGALSMIRNLPESRLKATVYLGAGYCNMKQKRYPLANAYLDTALAISQKTHDAHDLHLAYKYKKELELALNNYSAAYDFLSRQLELEDKIFNEETMKKVQYLEEQSRMAEMEKEQAEVDIQLARKRQVTYSGVVIVAAIMLASLIVINRQRLIIKNDKKLFETKQSLAAAERENAQLREKELLLEIEEKNKQLASYTMNFIQKSELLADLKENLHSLSKNLGAGFSKQLSSFQRLIDATFKIDKDWEDFKTMFEQIHHDFFTALKLRFPELTQNDLKLCALIKLNLSVGDMSRMLGISQESVRTSRYRLRKKLGLKDDENITDFIFGFDASENAMDEHPTNSFS